MWVQRIRSQQTAPETQLENKFGHRVTSFDERQQWSTEKEIGLQTDDLENTPHRMDENQKTDPTKSQLSEVTHAHRSLKGEVKKLEVELEAMKVKVLAKNEVIQMLKVELGDCKVKLGKEVTKLTVANIIQQKEIAGKDVKLAQLQNQVKELKEELIAVLNADLSKVALTAAKVAAETMKAKMAAELPTPSQPHPVSNQPFLLEVLKTQTKAPGAASESLSETNGQDESRTRVMFHLQNKSTIAELRPIFASAGMIKNFYYNREKVDKSGKSFGFVTYLKPEDAENAIWTLNGTKLQDQVLEVSYPLFEPGTKVMFRLEHPSTAAELRPLFASAGGVKDFVYTTGSSHGFVTYFRPEDAKKAILSLNQVKVQDQVMKVTYPFRLKNSKSQSNLNTRVMFHVDKPSTIAELRPIFASFGAMESFQYNNLNVNALGCSYGFVNYLRVEDAEKAVLSLNGSALHVKYADF